MSQEPNIDRVMELRQSLQTQIDEIRTKGEEMAETIITGIEMGTHTGLTHDQIAGVLRNLVLHIQILQGMLDEITKAYFDGLEVFVESAVGDIRDAVGEHYDLNGN